MIGHWVRDSAKKELIMPLGSRFGHLMRGDGVTTGEVHWGAVLAGIIVTLVGQTLLTLLGAGLGAASFDPTQGDRLTGEGAAWGAYAYWVIAGIASAFAGGWTAGWVAGSLPRTDRIEGSFQGFLAWGSSTLIVVALVLGLASGSVVAARLGGPLGAGTIERLTDTTTPSPSGAADQEQVADAASAAALWSFFALLIGAFAAMGGGYLGVGHAKRMIATTIRPTGSDALRTPGQPTGPIAS